MRTPIIVSRDHPIFPGMSIQVKSPRIVDDFIKVDIAHKRSMIAYYGSPSAERSNNITSWLRSLKKEDFSKEIFVICQVDGIERLDDNISVIHILALYRAHIISYEVVGTALIALDFAPVTPIDDFVNEDEEKDLRNLLTTVLEESYHPHFSRYNLNDKEINNAIDEICSLEIKNNHATTTHHLFEILQEVSVRKRLLLTIKMLKSSNRIAKYDLEIEESLRKQIDQNQREFYLKERLKAITKELNQDESVVGQLESKFAQLKLPQEAHDKIRLELNRFKTMYQSSPEWDNAHHYLQSVLSLPWEKHTDKFVPYKIKLAKVKSILDKHHYGLSKVKEKVLDYVSTLQRHMEVFSKPLGSVMCLVGAPGVGKTSIAHSIARAIDRKVIHISLAGIRDESEIRGHRKTYIAATMGVIMGKLRQAGTSEVVMVMDEIDKLSSETVRGNPATTLLEILDPTQNTHYRDHYVDLGFDLSRIIFIATANTLDIYPPLLDRLHIIELPSYSRHEKYHIGRSFIIPKIMSDIFSLPLSYITIGKEALYHIIDQYSIDSGVRSLQRYLRTIIEKTYRQMGKNHDKRIYIKKKNIESLIGLPQFDEPVASSQERIGVMRCLAFRENMSVGSIIPVEVVIKDPLDKNCPCIKITGNLGKVMNESAQIASIVASEYGECRHKDIYIHFLSGAVPKDGPSAGMAICSAIISANLNKPIRSNIAMTGELSLTGKVLPIGGVAEKIRVAVMTGMREIILPAENAKQVAEMDRNEFSGTKIHYVNELAETYNILFNSNT